MSRRVASGGGISRAVRGFARWILKTWFALGWEPRLRRPGRDHTGCGCRTLAALTPPSILCGATVPAAAASACFVRVAGVGWVLGRCRLSSGGPQGWVTIAASFVGTWYDPYRALCWMVASALVISGSSAAGRLLRICLPPEVHTASTPGQVQTASPAPLTTRTSLGVSFGVPGCTGGA